MQSSDSSERAPEHRERTEALDRLVEAAGPDRAGWGLVTRLLAGDPAARRLALELVPRLPLPVEPSLIPPLRGALSDRQVPSKLRVAIAAHLLSSLPSAGSETEAVLDALTKDVSSARAVAWLRALRTRVVGCEKLDERFYKLEARVPMRCPRCKIKLPRPAMVKHLWQEHRLMLDGQQVRQPWRLVEDWLREYAATGQARLLEQATELAEQLDPVAGAARVQRLLLVSGRADLEVLENLRAEARRSDATLCPHCFALAPLPTLDPVPLATVSGGRIACRGFAAEVSDDGLFPRLRLEAPGEPTYHARAPGRWLTSHGVSMALAGPCVLLALIAALYWPEQWGPPLLPTLALVALGWVLHANNRQRRGEEPHRRERVVGLAWQTLLPTLLNNGYAQREADFGAGLAAVSTGMGDPHRREAELSRVSAIVREGVHTQEAAAEQLAPLRRLAVSDAAEQDRDPVLVLVNEVAPTLSGELPLDFAELMLADWGGQEWWTRGNRARMRILLCGRAFEAGLGVWELQELGHVFPRLAEVLVTEDLDGLARLCHLWGLLTERPWDDIAPATPVFDLARYPVLGGQFLHAHPDLLFFQSGAEFEEIVGSPSPILVCEEGVLYRDHLIRDADGPVKLKARPLLHGGGFEMTAGTLSMQGRKGLLLLAKRLNGWHRYLFKDFLPGVEGVLNRRNRRKLTELLRSRTVKCPDCQRNFFQRRHDVGIAIEGT